MVDQIDIAPVDLKDTSPEYQEQLISTKYQLEKLAEEQRKGITKEAAAGPNIFAIAAGLPTGAPIVEEARKEVIRNKLEIISNHLGQRVNNQDLAFFGDFGLSFTLPRSKSFHNIFSF